jgi:hypothetical protein
MSAEPILEPITPSDMPRDHAATAEALARLDRIYAELEQDIARAVSDVAQERDPDDRKGSISRRVLALFGYGEP